MRGDQLSGYVSGMRLLDLFAGQALMGMLANSDALMAAAKDCTNEEFLERVANSAYRYAEAMLKARES